MSNLSNRSTNTANLLPESGGCRNVWSNNLKSKLNKSKQSKRGHMPGYKGGNNNGTLSLITEKTLEWFSCTGSRSHVTTSVSDATRLHTPEQKIPCDDLGFEIDERDRLRITYNLNRV